MPVQLFVGVGVPQAAGAVLGKSPTFVRPVGIVATSPVRPTTSALRYIRKTGSDTNGGSSASLTPDAQGTDGVTNGTTLFTAASGSFTQADVDKLVMITTKARYRIVAVASTTSVTLSGSPSAGSGLTWKLGGAVATIAALLSTANSPAGSILGGDTVYIGAGVYREVNPTLPTPTFGLVIEGDVTGFWTGDPGMVQWSAYLTDDRTAPTSTPILTFASKSNFTFNNIFFVGGSGAMLNVSLATQNLTFNKCAFVNITVNNVYADVVPFGTYRNTNFNGCYFFSQGTALAPTLVTGTGSHYDVGITIRNCFVLGAATVTFCGVIASAALVGKGGGVRILGCSFSGVNGIIQTAGQNSASVPCQVYGCVVIGASTALNAAAFGQIVEGQNFLVAATPRSSVGAGAGSYPGPNFIANSLAGLFHFGQESIWNAMPRHILEPLVGSTWLGFIVDNGGFDIVGARRPDAGGIRGGTVGAVGRSNAFTRETSTPISGSNSISLLGPGYHDFKLPVDTTATTVTVQVNRDSNYTGPPPELTLIGAPQLGVPTAVAPAGAAAAATTETLTLPTFTATAVGVVTLRIASYDTSPSGNGKTVFDTFTIT